MQALFFESLNIRGSIAAGLHTYDFLDGHGRHKTDWGAEFRVSRNVRRAGLTGGEASFSGFRWRVTVRGAALDDCFRRRFCRYQTSWKPHDEPTSIPASRWGHSERRRETISPRCARRDLIQPVLATGIFCTKVMRSNFRSSAAGHRLWATSSAIAASNDAGNAFFDAMPVSLFEQQLISVTTLQRWSVSPSLSWGWTKDPRQLYDCNSSFGGGYEDQLSQPYLVLRKYGIPRLSS